jgi:hypothetical protein
MPAVALVGMSLLDEPSSFNWWFLNSGQISGRPEFCGSLLVLGKMKLV